MSENFFEYTNQDVISINKNIRFHPDLSCAEKLFYAEIDSLSKEKSIPLICKELKNLFHVSHQTVLNWVKKLISLDLLEISVECVGNELKHSIKTKPAK